MRARKAARNYTIFNEPNFEDERQVLLPIPFSHLRPVKTIINAEGEKEDVILGTLSDRDLISMGRAEEVVDPDPPEEELTTSTPPSTQQSVPESEDQRLAREQASVNRTPDQIQEQLPQPTPRSADQTGQKALKALQAKTKNEKKDPTTASDTLRLEIDTSTWTPTLLRAPLPGSVIDELRGKYSVFRTRHDPEYMRHLQRVDSARRNHEKWVQSGGGLLDTPRREVALRTQAEKKEALKKQGRLLDNEVLKGIGKMMWDRGMRLTAEQEFEAAERFKKEYGAMSPGIGSRVDSSLDLQTPDTASTQTSMNP